MGMENLTVLMSVLGKMMILIALGFVMSQLGLLTGPGRKSVTNLVIDLIYPCYVINSFINNIGMFSGENVLRVLTVSIVYSTTILAVSRLVFPKAPPERQAVLRYSIAISNSAFLGLPLMENLFGSQGLLYASLYTIPLRINTFGIAVGYFTPKGEGGVWRRLRSTLTQPSIVATMVGIGIILAGWRPPELCVSVLSSVGACSTPLSMMVIGAVIHENMKEMRLRKLTMEYTFVRLLLIPAVVFGIFRLLKAERLLMATGVLMAAMPAGTTGALFADKYGKDVRYAGELVLISTLICALTLPFWCYLCMYA